MIRTLALGSRRSQQLVGAIKERRVRIYKPLGRHCDVDGLVMQKILEVAKGPCLGRSPRACPSPHHKRGVSRDISHKLERARFLVELINDGGVELVVIDEELGQRVGD